MHEHDATPAQPRELVERVPGREKNDRKCRRLLEAQALRQRLDLQLRETDAARVTAEARDAEHGVAGAEAPDTVADGHHRSRNLEARNDGPADVFFGRFVEPHPHHQICKVHTGGAHLHTHFVTRRGAIRHGFDKQACSSARPAYDDLFHP
jgi:hypothetical protein